jgi:hypothetical protein
MTAMLQFYDKGGFFLKYMTSEAHLERAVRHSNTHGKYSGKLF